MQRELEQGSSDPTAPERPEPGRQLSVLLEPHLDAPAQARHTVSRWLLGHGCPARLVVNMTLVTSELVTNAVVHARSAPQVRALIGAGLLRVEVHDEVDRPPVPSRSMSVAGGRGLHVVARVTDRWGWCPTGTGKYVWAEMTYDDLQRPADVLALAERHERRQADTGRVPGLGPR